MWRPWQKYQKWNAIIFFCQFESFCVVFTLFVILFPEGISMIIASINWSMDWLICCWSAMITSYNHTLVVLELPGEQVGHNQLWIPHTNLRRWSRMWLTFPLKRKCNLTDCISGRSDQLHNCLSQTVVLFWLIAIVKKTDNDNDDW